MIKEDIPLYKLDLTGKDKFNKVSGEYGFRRKVKNNNIVVPPRAPFYQKSFKMFDKAGELLIENKDYKFYGIMSKLTQYTGQPVGLFVELLNPDLTEWYYEYQVVGNFNKITNEILDMLHSIYEDDRYVMYPDIENKPLWFIPEIHQHDLAYDIYGFTDLVTQINRIATLQANENSISDELFSDLQNKLETYINGYKEILLKLIASHVANQNDAHGTDKSAIGLDRVDNYLTATLEETIEGLREDLHITPYNAAIAAGAAAGRNDKLFPSGSLPLLRYGSDTFIPPTISGSFEGLGGQTRRVGGLIEADGTMLILQSRNNGKYRGLYFVRCANWASQSAEYEFTSYMYTHPTATADGANLDTIINGSNRYIMVVGDSVKNIWYYTETHGTFNPDRHVLHRITGPWVTEDMSYRPNFWYDNPEGKCIVVADENYADGWAIIQSYGIKTFSTRRTIEHPPEWYDQRTLNLDNAGYSIIYFKGLSSYGTRCRIDYTHEIFGNKNDHYFTPWWPEVEDDGTDGLHANIYSMFARYTRPTKYVFMHRSVHGMWMKAGQDLFNIRLTTTGIDDAGTKGRELVHPTFRGQLRFEQIGDEQWCHITPHEDMKLITLNPDDRNESNQAYKTWMESMNANGYPDDADRIGSFVVDKDYMHFSDGFGNSIFPSVYCLLQVPYLKNADALYRRPAPGSVSRFYKQNDGRLVFNEANPLGMTEAFVLQRWMTADTTDYTQTGFLIKQITPDGPEWVFRHSRFANSNWTHLRPSASAPFGGKVFSYWPFVSVVRKTNLGQQVRMSQSLPPLTGAASNNPYTHLFGASCNTTVMGTNKGINAEGTRADYLFPWITKTSIVDGQLQFQHQEVFNVKRLIQQDLPAVFGPAGYTAHDIARSWSLSQTVDPNGNIRLVAAVNRIQGRFLYMAVAIGTISGQGASSTVDGYKLWPDAQWTSLSSVRETLIGDNISPDRNDYNYWDQNSKDQPKINHGLCLTIPWTTRESDGVVSNAETYTLYIRQCQGHSPSQYDDLAAVVIEVSADSRNIVNSKMTYGSMWSMVNSLEPIPDAGIIRTQWAIETFEGSAIAGGPINATRVYDGIANDTYTQSGGIIGATNILTPAYTVYFNQIKNILLAGKMYDIPSTYIDIQTVDPSPANKIFYAYVYYSNGQAQYAISRDVRPETTTQSMIAKIITGSSQIERIIPYNRFTMDGAQITATRQGSGILASSGSVFDIGNTSAILQDQDFIP